MFQVSRQAGPPSLMHNGIKSHVIKIECKRNRREEDTTLCSPSPRVLLYS